MTRREVSRANGFSWVKAGRGLVRPGTKGASCWHEDALQLIAAANAYSESTIHIGFGGFYFFVT